MKKLYILSKILCVSLFLLLFFAFGVTDFAYARGGCFASGTAILTTEGIQPIEQLHQGDSIISYNFTTQRPEVGHIGEIKVVSSPDYYLINHKIKVTETHPFYIKTSTGVQLLKVQQLKIGDRFIGEAGQFPAISSIDYVKKPITVYNLISINPNHNFYADGVLVHNKGGSGGGGGGGSGGYRGSYGARGNSSYTPITSKTLPKIILELLILVLALLPVIFFRELYNFVRFFGKKFSNDPELIEFTKKINSKFNNCYSLRYRKNKELWKTIPIESEIEEQQYQHLLDKSELVAQAGNLFAKYQLDWTMKQFDQMQKYIQEPFYSQQRNILKCDIGDNFDIIYNPELIAIAPISFTQDGNHHIFRLQMNAKTINFVLSPKGYVLSGEAHPLFFTEYWDVSVDSAKNWYLRGISQIL